MSDIPLSRRDSVSVRYEYLLTTVNLFMERRLTGTDRQMGVASPHVWRHPRLYGL